MISNTERPEPKTGQVYRHFKGNNYEIIALAQDTETDRTMVVYRALYDDFKIYTRELGMFMSLTDTEKYPDSKQRYRFECLSELEPDLCRDKISMHVFDRLVKFGHSLDSCIEVVDNLPEEFKNKTGFRLASTSVNNCSNCSFCHQEGHMFGPGYFKCTKYQEVSEITSLMTDRISNPCSAYTCNYCDGKGSK